MTPSERLRKHAKSIQRSIDDSRRALNAPKSQCIDALRSTLVFSQLDADALLACADAWDREQWRPISEAPKDGGMLLLGEFVYGPEDLGGPAIKHFYQDVGVFAGDNWQAWGRNLTPTHFRALPEPPKEEV